MITLVVNGKKTQVEVDTSTPILWVIREQIKLTGTKFGCGAGLCGACTVHLDGKPIRSCSTPISAAENKEITTIEGIGTLESGLHPVQEAWLDEQVPQCGYCQSGQMMSAVALLNKNPTPSDDDINEAMKGNICRCGMYNRIKKGIHRASDVINSSQLNPKNNG